MFDLSGKLALVTGANTGLGQGMVIALAVARSANRPVKNDCFCGR